MGRGERVAVLAVPSMAVRVDLKGWERIVSNARVKVCESRCVKDTWYLVCSINLISVSCGHAHVMTVSRLRPSHAW